MLRRGPGIRAVHSERTVTGVARVNQMKPKLSGSMFAMTPHFKQFGKFAAAGAVGTPSPLSINPNTRSLNLQYSQHSNRRRIPRYTLHPSHHENTEHTTEWVSPAPCPRQTPDSSDGGIQPGTEQRTERVRVRVQRGEPGLCQLPRAH